MNEIRNRIQSMLIAWMDQANDSELAELDTLCRVAAKMPVSLVEAIVEVLASEPLVLPQSSEDRQTVLLSGAYDTTVTDLMAQYGGGVTITRRTEYQQEPSTVYVNRDEMDALAAGWLRWRAQEAKRKEDVLGPGTDGFDEHPF